MHAGVAVAVRRGLQCRIIDDFDDDILGALVETTKGPIILLTHYNPPRPHYIPTAALENKLQKNKWGSKCPLTCHGLQRLQSKWKGKD